jgi:hypothetical protein
LNHFWKEESGQAGDWKEVDYSFLSDLIISTVKKLGAIEKADIVDKDGNVEVFKLICKFLVVFGSG